MVVDLRGQKAHKLKRSCRRGMLLLGEELKGRTWQPNYELYLEMVIVWKEEN